MRKRLLSPSLLCLPLLVGCARIPPRPVPLPEGEAALPRWYPQKEWSAEAEVERVYLEGKVVFVTAKSYIRYPSEKVLSDLMAYLKANPDITRIRLEGHTDSRAEDDYNQKLSERRVIAVADWLVDRGFDHDALIATAFGETRPLWPNISAVAMQENRRTSFHIAEISGNRFRGEDPTHGGMVLYVMSKAEREAAARKGKVPTVKPPPVKVELDIIKPVAKQKLRDPLDDPDAKPDAKKGK